MTGQITHHPDAQLQPTPPQAAQVAGGALHLTNGAMESKAVEKQAAQNGKINPKKIQPEEAPLPKKPTPLKSVRYYVVLIALISPFVGTFAKVIINFALIDMIDPGYLVAKSSPKSATTNLTSSDLNDGFYFEKDHSCPVDSDTRERLICEMNQDIKEARLSSGEKFAWDTFKQGLLKAAYPIGHSIVQVPGGRMAEIYGSHWVMTLSALLTGLCCLSAPYLAAAHFYLLFADLVMLGLLGSAMTPALFTLFTNWLTPGEKSITIPFYLVTSRLGYALSSVLCGLLIQADLSWRYVFFTSGIISIVWTIIFFACARSRPTDHPLISQLEIDYLMTKNSLVRECVTKSKMKAAKVQVALELKTTEVNGAISDDANKKSIKEAGKKKVKAPWSKIMTNVPVWAFIVTKFCVKLSGDTVSIELPTYLNRVMHFSAKDNGFLNGWSYVMFCIGCLSVGALAKVVVKKRPFDMSKTFIRKTFQSVASFGTGLCLLGIAFSVCDRFWTELSLLCMFFITTFGTGGEAQIPMDITDRYSGTIHAIGSSIAISGAIEPTLVGFLLRGRGSDKESWKLVWMGASFMSFIGGLVFIVFGDATIQGFNSYPMVDLPI